ncbi:hypothetical protein N2152v2_003264 [Parachlorella kessleri]
MRKALLPRLGRWFYGTAEQGGQASQEVAGSTAGPGARRWGRWHSSGGQGGQRQPPAQPPLQQQASQQTASQLGTLPLWGRQKVSVSPATLVALVISSAAAGSGVPLALSHWNDLRQHLPQPPGFEGLRHLPASAMGFLRSFHAHAHAPAPLEVPTPSPAAPPPPVLSPYFISEAAAKAAPAVVNIMVHSNGMPGMSTGSSGSGFIVDADGTILTNAHVLADAIMQQKHHLGAAAGAAAPKGITITLQDGRIFAGRLVNFDTVSDLAVLKVDSDTPLPHVKMGTSSGLRVGEWVVALGSPLHLQNSVTAGIVSCVDRKAVELGLAGARTDYIQTDAAINKGNSGGPLVNLQGEVVGISAMKALAADGVSFAIPVDTALDVMRQLRQHGRVIRPYAGMKMLQLNRHSVLQFRSRDPNFPNVSAGILIPQVYPGSPADKAGLKAGDIIIGFPSEYREVTTANLVKALTEHVGRDMQLRVARPHNEEVVLQIRALEAGDGGHGHH